MASFASPADVAAAVAFLADSEQSGFINGQAIAVAESSATTSQ
jgi:NAD(P)-dependent dehydrogenase (short-subunit alcohol dehydrogenase family)